MIDKEIHWLDLDETLITSNAKYWIVDKKNPTNYIIRLSMYESNLILSGYYKNDNLPIKYNGIEGWLSNEIITKIRSKKNIDIKELGISFREYQDEDLIIKQTENLLIYIDRVKHLQNVCVNLLTARGNKKAHKPLLDKLDADLLKYNIKINDAYFVNDPLCVKMYGSTPEKKLICILESIIGHKIENNVFVPLLINKFDEVHFYDDDELNIDICKKMNFYINQYLMKTPPWLKQKIEESIKFRTIKLHLHLVTSNELNPFITEEIDIKITGF